MSNDNPPKPKRSFRIVFKIINFIVAMAFTFCVSFAATVVLKSEHPADFFGIYAEDFFPQEEPDDLKTGTAPPIKMLFDTQTGLPLEPQSNDDDEQSDEKIPDAAPPQPDTAPPQREAEKLGVLDKLDRMTSIKPAVDEKIKNIPHYVTLNEMPNLLCQAVVSVEDARFYSHRGFDVLAIARAALVNVEAGTIQEGASTITQQTVKNLFLTSDQTFARKAEELVLSMNMEKDFDKNKILEIYLNVIYFGSNFYGIYDAAHGYFGKEPAALTIAECAMLAGLPNAPSLYSPYVDYRLAKKRQLVVIDAMEKAGVISAREAESARIEEIILAQ